ncbi:MAG: polysaccharide deacetylase family protein [Butyricicoccaceae bacterium]
MDTAPELVLRMVQEGHIVGNHTLHHPDMSAIQDEASFSAELDGLADKYRELTKGEEMKEILPSAAGKFSESNLAMAQKLGYRTIFWSLAYVDWYTDDQPTDEQAFSKLVPRIHPGAVVLLHSTSATNARILDELLAKWEALGYRFASLEELAGERRNEGASRVVLEQLRQLGLALQRDARGGALPGRHSAACAHRSPS